MLRFKKKKHEKERVRLEAIANSRKEQVVRTIEKYFPTERGLRSHLGSIEMITKVIDIATGNAPKDISLFLRFLDRDPKDPECAANFEKMYKEING